MYRLIIICTLILLPAAAHAKAGYSLYVDRSARKLYVMQGTKVVSSSSVGIGRGGIGKKWTMDDEITPTGTFVVDVVLSPNPAKSSISSQAKATFAKQKQYAGFVQNGQGLTKLLSVMNAIDFDRNKKPDKAYGGAYIGLQSTSGAVTGPKMSWYQGKPYWYSIGLHGTPEAGNIGRMRSGGCVHVPADMLSNLVNGGIVKVGTQVVIDDRPPR